MTDTLKRPSSIDAAPRTDPVSAELVGRIHEWLVTATTEDARSLQHEPGPSEIGHPCARQLTYKLTGTAPVNMPDGGGLAALAGTGVHEVLSQRFAGRARFVVEQRVTYRGVSGRFDLYDRMTRTLADLKTAGAETMRKVNRDGLNPQHRVQASIYGAGLVDAGEHVDWIAVLYLPMSGRTSDAVIRVEPFDQSIADEAIDRLDRLRDCSPVDAPATPAYYCQFCPWFRPESNDPSSACPGTVPPESTTGRK